MALRTFDSVEQYVAELGGTKPFRKVLIANNGIAAVKAIRSVRRWAYETFGDARAIQFVVMTTPEDLRANAEYIRMADEFREVPGGSNNNNYANVQLIVELAKGCGVDAVWAGWGHASENPALPNALSKTEPRIAFIGPPAAPMQALGDKIGSTIIAQSAGVSTIPWNGQGLTVRYAEEGIPDEVFQKANLRTAEEAEAAAAVVGYPLMIKASEGGGGKGIRKVTDPANLATAFRQVQAELRGSPIFLMQLAPQARHLEVQLLADEHGQAISLSGRDCSVQRRHQKIMEEGPVLAAPKDVWMEMERAAVRLAKEVGYVNAGTVEYLFREATNEFAFLELNPRLQVEHPVTEMITGVNLPACQFQVSMGIALHRIPDIRRLYNEDPWGDSKIDFDTATQHPPKGHVIAARITAEDPEQGFQPTSGAVTELNFRSTPDVWGYFSVDSSGRVHEYADSQIGHLFGFGETRDMARRQLVLALKELSIRGDIHTTVEYLVELLENPEYRKNKIDTSWLDRRIASNVVTRKPDAVLVAVVGGVVRAHDSMNTRAKEYRACLERGQVPPTTLLSVDEPVELIYDSVKYELHTSKSGPNTYIVACNGTYVSAEVRMLSDGGYLVLLGGKSHVAYSREEPSGLRLVLDGATCMFTNEYDPTQLRAAMSGKLARYLVEEGATLAAGEPYAEVEVMKMYMQVTVPEAGTISFVKPEGSILEPGELIASVVLEDPSKVHKAELFAGQLPKFAKGEQPGYFRKPHVVARNASDILQNVMQGYEIPLDEFERVLADRDAAFADPMLPFTEFEEIMSVLAGRLPFQLADKLGEIRKVQLAALTAALGSDDAGASTAVAGRVAFDVSEIAASVDEAEAALPPRDRAAFRATAEPLRNFVAASRLGLDGANNANLLQFLQAYASVEQLFHGRRAEEVISDLRLKHSGDDLDRIYDVARAHNQIRQRNRLVMSLLSRVMSVLERAKHGPGADALRARAGDDVGATAGEDMELPNLSQPHPLMRPACSPTAILPTLNMLAELGGANYAEVSLEARQMLMVLQQPSLKERIREIETVLRSGGFVKEYIPATTAPRLGAPVDDSDKLGKLVNADSITVGMITRFLSDDDQMLRQNAVQVYIRRLYRAYHLRRVNAFEKRTSAGQFTGARWTFTASDSDGGSTRFVQSMADSSDNLVALGQAASSGSLLKAAQSPVQRMGLSKLTASKYVYNSATVRAGVLAVFDTFSALVGQFDALLETVNDGSQGEAAGATSPNRRQPLCVNVLHVVLLDASSIDDVAASPTRRPRSNSGVAGIATDEHQDESREKQMVHQLASFLRARRAVLDAAGIRRVTFLLPHASNRVNNVNLAALVAGAGAGAGAGVGAAPPTPPVGRRRAGSSGNRSVASTDNEGHAASFSRVYTFRHSMDFNEDTIVRHMEPPLAGHLELKRLGNFRIRQMPTPNLSIHVYEAVPRREALEAAEQALSGVKGGGGRHLEHTPAAARRRRQKTRKRFFVRAIVLQTDRIESVRDVYEQYPGAEGMFVEALNALNVAMGDALLDTTHTVGNNHIFLNVVPVTRVDPTYVEAVIQRLAKRYSDRLRRLRVSQVEFKIHAQFMEGSPVVPVRLIATNPTGYVLNVDCYAEARDPASQKAIFTSISMPSQEPEPKADSDGLDGDDLGVSDSLGLTLPGMRREQSAPSRRAELDGKDVMSPYPVATHFERRRALAAAITDTLYVFDFLELLNRALEMEWNKFARENPSKAVRRPRRLVDSTELVLAPRDSQATGTDGAGRGDKSGAATPASGAGNGDDDEVVLVEAHRPPGSNTIAMVAWRLTLFTPECPDGRDMVIIANDITVKAGSFGTAEDKLFEKASAYARERGIPRLYIAANSGARIGLAEEVKKVFRAAWVDPQDVTKGFRYLYVTAEDYEALKATGSINAQRVEEGGEVRYRIDDIIGKDPDLGVENLRGSGTIAGETSRAYSDIFTLTYVTGRSVGIGAYLVRLGQRTIQKAESAPILLTGYQALNKLIGSNVYTSNQQLGGPKVMYANGVTHEIVDNDLEGISAVIKWLAYVPRFRGGPLPILERENDVVDRPIAFKPSGAYDPRHLIAGYMKSGDADAGEDEADTEATTGAGSGAGSGAGAGAAATGEWVSGFFDRGSWRESLASWARTVVVGRARLGGIPMGVIVAETRSVSTTSPADPAAPMSQETVTQQAGQVWYPDSAFKTAQAIRDFAGEELPLMIFANWRGFSGGQRDMFNEILKFGSDIVDALVAYKQPVFVYIPPGGELRGGAWVVVDSTINSACMEMYAETGARGGVLEPSGITAIKFRTKDLRAAAHRLDAELIRLDKAVAENPADRVQLRAQIESRERHLVGVYTQLSQSFADLHDRPGRMFAKGTVRKVVPWAAARKFFYWRLRRRRAIFSLRARLVEAAPSLSPAAASDMLRKWFRQRMTARGVVASGKHGDLKWEEDDTVLEWLSSSRDWLQAKQAALRRQYISRQIVRFGDEDAGAVVHGVLAMIDRLPADMREAVVGSLKRGVIFSR